MKGQASSRFIIVAVIASLVGSAIGIQMIRIQNIPAAAEILAQSENYRGFIETIYPERGNIYDAEGNLLAGNEATFEVGLDLASVAQPETIAAVASSVLGLDYAEVLASAQMTPGNGNPYYVVLEGFATKEEIDELEKINQEYEDRNVGRNETKPSLRGLIWTAQNKRSYPEGDLASNIIGFYSFLDKTEGKGYFGVEEAYNDLLAGTPKQVFKNYDPVEIPTTETVSPGASLVLTIDRDIQSMTENVLSEAIDWSGAEAGTILVYNPEDGSVLAMATTPRLDPNEYWKYSEIFPNPTPYNRAISKSYEPGSVFKVLTMAAALDAGAVTPETVFHDTGSIMVGGTTITNWNYGAWGDQDMTGCMQHSLNVCLSWIAMQLGADRFYSYLKNFGLDRNTGIDLGGEVHFPLKVPGDNQWYEVDLATNSFGQGISLTPIQMVMAIGSVANEGKMMAPHVVKSMIIDGRQYEVNPVIVGTPLKPETATTLTSMLVTSLEEESSVALVEGYSVAGKTGTAEIPTEFGYTSSVTNTSFVGWGPAEDPKFLVYVWLEKPTISIWGSEVAAPVFSDVVKNLVVLMDIPPDNIRLKSASTTNGE